MRPEAAAIGEDHMVDGQRGHPPDCLFEAQGFPLPDELPDRPREGTATPEMAFGMFCEI